MRRTLLGQLFAAVFLFVFGWTVYTQNAKQPGPLRTTKIKDDLYVISGEGGKAPAARAPHRGPPLRVPLRGSLGPAASPEG